VTKKIALTVGDGTQAASQLSLTGGKLDLQTNGVAIDYAAGANDAAALTSVLIPSAKAAKVPSVTAFRLLAISNTRLTSSSSTTSIRKRRKVGCFPKSRQLGSSIKAYSRSIRSIASFSRAMLLKAWSTPLRA
jgi:ABC-type Na+ efflux pump permease subunit